LGYEVVFPSERVERAFVKTLAKIPADDKDSIVAVIRSLTTNPRPQRKRDKKLSGHIILLEFTAEYR
jgi:mRNA interferase RelE/StbE